MIVRNLPGKAVVMGRRGGYITMYSQTNSIDSIDVKPINTRFIVIDRLIKRIDS